MYRAENVYEYGVGGGTIAGKGGGVHARTIGMGEGVNTHVIPSRVNTFADLLGVVIAI